jgi:predicted 3-demethylubiquinone-9 3-methyltransferase (glyoxalase superfamily)
MVGIQQLEMCTWPQEIFHRERKGTCCLSWQITPIALTQAISDSDPASAKRAFNAMMEMTKIDISIIETALRG